MPHVIVEYSANIESEITPQRLVEEIHAAAIRSLNNNPVAIGFPHATNAMTADTTAQSGP